MPESVLDAWTVLEVLSPKSFRHPEDIAGGDRQRLADLSDGELPWSGAGEPGKPSFNLYYQVVLGSLDLGKAIGRLLERYSDLRPERPAKSGQALAAVATLDRHGKLVEAPAVTLASFAWGLPLALRGELAELAGWPEAKRGLAEALEDQLRPRGEGEKDRPLQRRDFERAWRWLVEELGLPEGLLRGPRYALRCYEPVKNDAPPETLLFDNFFLEDLAAARRLFAANHAPATLEAYFGRRPPARRRALLTDDATLEEAVAPQLVPPVRWPGAGRHPLVLLQQAAVNLGLAELEETGIFAVNGPPGTGKTTLLRDFFASVVTARAETMAQFDDPAAAFRSSGETMRAGAAWLQLHHLDERLQGFEMLVASSNNKAVENVSEALPEASALAPDLGLRYFSSLADELLGRPTWGLAAAVLGKSSNRTRFRQTFWWHPDVGMWAYLGAAAGYTQLIDEPAPGGGKPVSRSPRIVDEEDPPRDPAAARERWREARRRFAAALAEARRRLAWLEAARQEAARLPRLKAAMSQSTAEWATSKAAETKARERAAAANAELDSVARAIARLQQALDEVDRRRPGFFARLFKSAAAREWQEARAPLQEAWLAAGRQQAELSLALIGFENEERQAAAAAQQAGLEHRRAAAQLEGAAADLRILRQENGASFVDDSFFARPHAEKQQAVPWLDRETQLARDEVFAAAMRLHRAFVDAAAKPLRHNLGALMNVFSGSRLDSAAQQALLPDLWRSLFLVVPLVSTTFASVERMLGDLPPASLGWLFVDEAGQALPQHAVGALMRVRRAVVVGDPVQIEPVVALPESLTKAIFARFAVDADRFGAPAASAQTLADAATGFYAEFQGRFGTREVGMPLLVHRRCAEPMFGIANAIAYDHQMVQATPQRSSPIGKVLGPSAFVDVRGGSSGDKWSPEEGEAVLAMLHRLATAGVRPDLYLVTPFVVVADNLRRIVREAPFAEEWLGDAWAWTQEHVGTVHTVQGREAEAVMLVLGAPAADQNGARTWAGGQPNLLNVAVTRAKERLYVIGNRELWRQAGLFRELDARLPK